MIGVHIKRTLGSGRRKERRKRRRINRREAGIKEEGGRGMRRRQGGGQAHGSRPRLRLPEAEEVAQGPPPQPSQDSSSPTNPASGFIIYSFQNRKQIYAVDKSPHLW